MVIAMPIGTATMATAASSRSLPMAATQFNSRLTM